MNPELDIPDFRQGQVRMKIFYKRLRHKGFVYCTACCAWLYRRAKGRHARAHERAGWPMLDFAVWRVPVGGILTEIAMLSEEK